jgi:hypothetical protein
MSVVVVGSVCYSGCLFAGQLLPFIIQLEIANDSRRHALTWHALLCLMLAAASASCAIVIVDVILWTRITNVYTIYLTINVSLQLPTFISLTPPSYLLLSLQFHRILSIRGLTYPASATSQGPTQLIGMTHLVVCVKGDDIEFQLEPEGLESWNKFPCLHFRNFNPNYFRCLTLMYET